MQPISRRDAIIALSATAAGASFPLHLVAQPAQMQSWPLAAPQRTGIHDVAPAPDGGVWFSAQRSGHLGWFDPKTGRTELIALGKGSSPHGVIQGPDKAAWLTDGGLNAIVRVGWPDRAVRAFSLPDNARNANLNTATFDGEGDLWFTGQNGVVGKVALKTGDVTVKDAPRGRGPYGICTTPSWRRLVVLAGRLVHRPDRPAHRRIDHRRATDQESGRTPCVERQQGSHLGKRMAKRQSLDAQPVSKHLECLEGSG